MGNSDIFLDAFTSIEKHLRRRCKVDRRVPFYQLVEEAAKSLPEVRRYRDDLKEYADLRNAIVHESSDGHVIAEPNSKAVESIKRLASLILKPPTVLPLFQTQVITLNTSDTIGAAVTLMVEHSFSQIPIIRDGHIVGLLTTNTIARWLGANVREDIFSLSETTINDVIAYTEDPENHVFVNRRITLFEVLERFQDFENRGKKLEAVLMTDAGKSTQRLLGILTVSDLPKVLSELRP